MFSPTFMNWTYIPMELFSVVQHMDCIHYFHAFSPLIGFAVFTGSEQSGGIDTIIYLYIFSLAQDHQYLLEDSFNVIKYQVNLLVTVSQTR